MYLRRMIMMAGPIAVTVLPGLAGAQQPWSEKRAVRVVAIAVSPSGNDSGPGSPQQPFRSLERAQQAVRAANADADVVVTLGTGVFRLGRPLHFGAEDGGQAGHSVTWRAADGARPVISGGVAVTTWTLQDKARGIYVAAVSPGTDSRQLWVNDRLAPRARIEVPRRDVSFDADGVTLNDPAFDYLQGLPDQQRMELEGTGFFTDRYSPVAAIRGRKLVMQHPAWSNNIWGYDTISRPVSPEFAKLYLVNSPAFLSAPGQWYLDPAKGQLLLRVAPGASPSSMSIELPHLSYLLSINGTPERPIRDLTFQGIRFSHTSWLGPSSPEGYANQQSGAYLAGVTPDYPVDPIANCSWGCRAFETRRNEWSQVPAAVQVAAAERVTFDQDVFAHLGQVGLGIGNDAATNASGVGLGARSITVARSVFTDLSAGAIVAGGVRRDAHHPERPEQANRNLLIRNNRIRSVSKEYKDNSAILSTYVDSALILHNDLSDLPYDAIDIGWGWGLNDVGGNPIYRMAERGYYDYVPNLIYDTPTMHRNTVVAFNRIYGAKKLYEDGGAIYNLSASPGTVIAENYVSDIPGKIALYLDEGSKGITIRNNVVDGAGRWLNDNTVKGAYPLRVTTDNKAVANWHNTSAIGGVWDVYGNNLILDDQPVRGQAWPAEARRIMSAAGIEPGVGPVEYEEVR